MPWFHIFFWVAGCDWPTCLNGEASTMLLWKSIKNMWIITENKSVKSCEKNFKNKTNKKTWINESRFVSPIFWVLKLPWSYLVHRMLLGWGCLPRSPIHRWNTMSALDDVISEWTCMIQYYMHIYILLWKKSCTTLDGWNPINDGINHLSTGAGFLPSTVWHTSGGTKFMLLESFTKHPSRSTADHIFKSVLCGRCGTVNYHPLLNI